MFRLEIKNALLATFSAFFIPTAFADGLVNPCRSQALTLVEEGYNEGGIELRRQKVLDETPWSLLLLVDYTLHVDDSPKRESRSYLRFSCSEDPKNLGVIDTDGDSVVSLTDGEGLEIVDGTYSELGSVRFTASTRSCALGTFLDAPVLQPCLLPTASMIVDGERSSRPAQEVLNDFARRGQKGIVVGTLSEDGSYVAVDAIRTLNNRK